MKIFAVVIFAFCFLASASGSKKPKHCRSNADCKVGQCCSAKGSAGKHRYCLTNDSDVFSLCPEAPTLELESACSASTDCAEDECCVIASGESVGRRKRRATPSTGTCYKLGALGDPCLVSVTSIADRNYACPCGQFLTCEANVGDTSGQGNCTLVAP